MEKVQHIEDVDNFDWKIWEPAVKDVLVFIVDRKQNRGLLIHKKSGADNFPSVPTGNLSRCGADKLSLQESVSRL